MLISEKYPEAYFTVGIHPHNVKDTTNKDLYRLIELTKHEKCVAWGEIGLDYHFDVSQKDLQIAFFERQIDIADELSLPLVLHIRDAYKDADEVIRKKI